MVLAIYGKATLVLSAISKFHFFSPQGRNSGQKKRIDLTLRKTLTPRSSESGFHRNVKFATFEEAGRLCKTIPQNGVKVAPLGGRSVPKLPGRPTP